MKLLLLPALIIFWLQATAQQPEKIHIHFDKDIYLPGETVWFKAYVYSNGLPSSESSNLFVGFYNEQGKLIGEKRYPLFDGTANGDFIIPDTLTPKLLQVKAVTKNIQSPGVDNMYSRVLIVYHKDDPPLFSGASAVNQKFEFFPEGGRLVAGLNNYIACKSSGAAVAAITEEISGKVIDSVTVNESGMGLFQFIPEMGKKYMAVWRDDNGTQQKTFLPDHLQYGASLHTELAAGKLYYAVQKNTDAANYDTLHMLFQNGQQEILRLSIAMNRNRRAVSGIPADSLGAGLVQVSLFDAKWNLLQQKFIQAEDRQVQWQPQVNVIEKSLLAKGKNIIEIVVPDTLLTNLSLSVAAPQFYHQDPVDNIYADLLLKEKDTIPSSLQKGLSATDKKERELTLLTHPVLPFNWRRFTETEDNRPVTENYLSLKIGFSDKRYALTGKEMLSIIVSDKVNGKQFFKLSASAANSNKYFEQDGLIFYDSAKVYYSFDNNKTWNSYFTVYKDSVTLLPTQIAASPTGRYLMRGVKKSTDQPLDIVQDFIIKKSRKFNEVQTIKNVVVKAKYANPVTRRLLELDDKYATGMSRGLARGIQLNVLDDPTAEMQTDIINYILYRVPGLSVERDKITRARYLMSSRLIDPVPVTLLINDVESPYEVLESYRVSNIAYIKYVSGIVIGSSFTTSGGALFIYTLRGDEPERSGVAVMKREALRGYDIAEEFKQPDYNQPSEKSNPDYRSLIYWTPYIITDKGNHRVKLEFYNNDISSKLLLRLRGFNAAGKLVSIDQIIE
ncbi:MAG: hypothetical protein WAT19_14970 [Ferruginibacter sp.]